MKVGYKTRIWAGDQTVIGSTAVGKTWRAKKVVSDSPGLVDSAIGLANSVLN